MSERENLTALLQLATDRIDDSYLVQRALDVSRRRRQRRRGAAAAAVAAGLTAAVILGAHETGGHHAGLPPVTTTPSPSPTLSQTQAPEPHTWPAWDPREVDELPAAPQGIVAELPENIHPPHTSAPLAENPVEAAIAVIVHDRRIQVLGTDGEWRTVPASQASPQPSLSPNGTRLAVADSGPGDASATVFDLDTANSWTVPVPRGYLPYDYTAWTFLDEQILLLQDGDRAWFVDAKTGAANPAPTSLGGGLATAVDQNGGFLLSADWSRPNLLTDYDGTSTREVSMRRTGRLTSLQANDHTVAGTTYDDRPFTLVVADRATLTPAFRLPVVDPDANYSNGGLSTLALTQDGLLLLRDNTERLGKEGLRILAWNPSTNQMFIVSRTNTLFDIRFAQGLLADTTN